MDDAAEFLRSEEFDEVLQAALTGGHHGLVGFSAELFDWHNRPGSEISAGYRVHYEVAGQSFDEVLYATTASVGPPAAHLENQGISFDVWRYPHDPRLPALPDTCDPNTVGNWLRGTSSAEIGSPRLKLLAYRPLRRAVMRAELGQAVFFLKVLRPAKLPGLIRRQELLAQAGLASMHLGSPAEGVLIMPSEQGRPLIDLMANRETIPNAEQLLQALDRLPVEAVDLPRRPAWSERLDFHAATAAEKIGIDQAEGLRERIQKQLDSAPVGPVVATHGDFYEKNIFVHEGRLSVIDSDSLGPGLREDDLACALGHLAVLPSFDEDRFSHLGGVIENWTEEFSKVVNQDALKARVAAVILSLVAGVDQARAKAMYALAEEWIRSIE